MLTRPLEGCAECAGEAVIIAAVDITADIMTLSCAMQLLNSERQIAFLVRS